MINGLLDMIKNPNDIKTIDKKDLHILAGELRALLMANVSNNGGHLASNLGVVELTIAILRTFDIDADKVIWDVGHQTYVYKILTDRKDRFDTIRKKDGLSGFPKRSESNYDHFNTGHSSTSISAALGYARSSKIKGKKDYAIAVIGDGAMTGGMAFEALNDAGASGENIIVILNDNKMSITKNVGGFSEYFSRMRSSRLYSGTNISVKRKVEKIPLIGKLTSRAIHRWKSALKYLFSQNMLFEEMGFHYLGPIDGHDIKKLEKILKDAKKIKGPVLLHAVTIKGKGYPKAEEKPDIYHGVGKFDLINGFEEKNKDTFSDSLGIHLTDLALKDKNISVICPAVTLGCGLLGLAKAIPDRFFDVGIAEQHAVTMAAGMACSGFIPVVAGYSTFMQRAYDQILHDVCLMNLHVVFAFDRAGVIGRDGATHQGVYDLAYLSNMPNLKIFAPNDPTEMKEYLEYSLYKETGPVVIRYPKGKIEIPKEDLPITPGQLSILKQGSDCIIFSYGKMLEEAFLAAEILKYKGFDCAIADISCLKPIDFLSIEEIVQGKKLVTCLEDVVESGSCSMQIGNHLLNANIFKEYIGFNLGNEFDSSGERIDIIDTAELSGAQVAQKMLVILNNLK